jgi:AAA domain
MTTTVNLDALLEADPGPMPSPPLDPGEVGIEEATLNGKAAVETTRDSESAGSSWTAVDLAEAASGEGQPPPSILPRTDGPCLLYAGLVHELKGEPEAGKGWLALRATADLLVAGERVVYIDFEATAAEIVERLTALGVAVEAMTSRLTYFCPHEPLTNALRAGLDAALAQGPALVVLDGVTEAMTVHELDLRDNSDVARWLELLPRPAARSGAAVLVIDHVVKDREQRGRYGLGAGHKLAGVFVSYTLHVVEPFGRGREGKATLRLHKDRPGHIRTHADGDDVAVMYLRSDESGAVQVELRPPEAAGDFRPTTLMERISEAIELEPGLSKSGIRSAVSGKSDAKDLALQLLVTEGYVYVKPQGQAHRHHNSALYRAAEDPKVQEASSA